MANNNSAAKKVTVAKTKKGIVNTLYLLAGLFVGGLLEKYAMSKIAFLADTKVDASDASKTNKNYIGIVVKNAAYIVAGLAAGQMSNNAGIEYAGYGLAGYGGLKLAKSVSDNAKPFGLGSVYQHYDPTLLPQYPVNTPNVNGFESM